MNSITYVIFYSTFWLYFVKSFQLKLLNKGQFCHTAPSSLNESTFLFYLEGQL